MKYRTALAKPFPRRAGLLPLAALLAAFTPAILLPGRAADTVELKAKWPVGQRMVTQVTIDTKQEITGAPTGPMKQIIGQVQEMAVDVVRELDGGGRDIELRFLTMKMDMKMGSISVLNYDSDKRASSPANPLTGMLDKLAQARLYVELDASGDVVEVEGLEDLMKGMTGPGMGASMLEGMFNKDSVKQMGVVPQGLPGKAMKVGDQWPYEIELKLGGMGTLVVAMNFTFSGMETKEDRNCAVLDYTGTMSTKPAGGNSPVSMSITAGAMKGKTWFDPEAGMVVAGTAERSLKMKVSAMGQQMDIDQTQTTSNKLVRVERIPR